MRLAATGGVCIGAPVKVARALSLRSVPPAMHIRGGVGRIVLDGKRIKTRKADIMAVLLLDMRMLGHLSIRKRHGGRTSRVARAIGPPRSDDEPVKVEFRAPSFVLSVVESTQQTNLPVPKIGCPVAAIAEGPASWDRSIRTRPHHDHAPGEKRVAALE